MNKTLSQYLSPAALAVQGLRVSAVGGLYFLFAWLGIWLTREPGSVAALWVPNALLIGVLLRTPPQRWWIYLVAALVADGAANAMAGDPPALVASFVFANGSEVVLALVLIWRLLSLPLVLREPTQLLLLFGVGALSCAAGASAGAALLYVLLGAPFWGTWQTWFLADAVGYLVIVPAFVCATSKAAATLLRRPIEVVAAFVSTAVLTASVLWAPTPALAYLVAPLLLWWGFRLGVFACAVLSVLVVAIAAALTLHDAGLAVGLAGTGALSSLQSLQLYLGVVIVPALIASLSYRRARWAERALGASEERLRLAVAAARRWMRPRGSRRGRCCWTSGCRI